MISKGQFVYVVVLLVMFSCHMLTCSDAKTDTISPGQQLNASETIVSAGQMFELGFYVPTNSNNYYLSIWYKSISEPTVVWLANRDFPVKASAILSISDDGNLVIKQGKIIYMVTNITSTTANATLLDSGNLVVRDENSNIIWQSFDFPSDTFLPGMKLGYDKKNGKSWSYVSWRSANDPRPGNFTLKLDPGIKKRVQVMNGNVRYWDALISENDSNVFNFNNEIGIYMFHFSFVFEFNSRYLIYDLIHKDNISRLTIDASGQLKLFLWSEIEWTLLDSQPKQLCSVPGYCGLNAICSNFSSTYCSCLHGFDPISSEVWNSGVFLDGCSRKTNLQCSNDTNVKGGKDGFLKLPKVLLPKGQQSLDVRNRGECQLHCLSDCNCTGFSYTNHTCSFWIGDLMNLQQLSFDDISGSDFFLKLAASDLDSKKRPEDKRKLSIIISLTISGAILTLALVICQVWKKKHKRKGEDLLSFELSITPEPTRNEQPEVKHGKHKKEVKIPIFSFSSIRAATDNFSLSNKLGQGGFGPVYKGRLLNGKEVAVKRLSRKSGQGWDEFKNEAVLMANLQHKNLVKILGCCIDKKEKILVYEYLHNKSLDFFLFGSKNISILAWGTRVRIIEGIAQGLLYLHEFSRLQIIHRDLKASNVLLDEDMNPKISDFGMARIFGGDGPRATDRIVGTYGYMAPEYALEGVFSVKSDVFSFGILLLEILSGEKNTGFYQSNSFNLLGYAWDLWTSNRPLELMECRVKDDSSIKKATRYINIALLCVQECAEDRPTMSDVVLMLRNELTFLPYPMKPAFSNVRRLVDQTPNARPEIYSANDVTMSPLHAR